MMRPQPNIGPGGPGGPGMRDRRPDMGPGERPGPYRDGGYGRPPRRDDHDDSGAAAAVIGVLLLGAIISGASANAGY